MTEMTTYSRQVTLLRSPGRGSMPCSKYLLLQKRYEEAILSWAQIIASQLFGEPSLRSMHARQRALDARIEAKDRLNVHELSCSICLRKTGPDIPAAKAFSPRVSGMGAESRMAVKE
jgi:hypothetical protein